MLHLFKLNHLTETTDLAKKIAKILKSNMVVSLTGDLGAGKTTLIREIILSLGITGQVKSPTFTLLEEYEYLDYKILHFDLYRFAGADEWLDLGFDELFNESGYLAFIEWAERASELIPQIDWAIKIKVVDETSRELFIETQTNLGIECLQKLIKTVVV